MFEAQEPHLPADLTAGAQSGENNLPALPS